MCARIASLPPDLSLSLHFQADNHRGRGAASQRTERYVHRDQREDRLQREAGEEDTLVRALMCSGLEALTWDLPRPEVASD